MKVCAARDLCTLQLYSTLQPGCMGAHMCGAVATVLAFAIAMQCIWLLHVVSSCWSDKTEKLWETTLIIHNDATSTLTCRKWKAIFAPIFRRVAIHLIYPIRSLKIDLIGSIEFFSVICSGSSGLPKSDSLSSVLFVIIVTETQCLLPFCCQQTTFYRKVSAICHPVSNW